MMIDLSLNELYFIRNCLSLLTARRYRPAKFPTQKLLSWRNERAVGGRYTVNGVTHAYLLSGGQFTTFDYPGATFTGATAISPRGDIVGRYRDANNVFHGFMLVRIAAAFSHASFSLGPPSFV